MKNIKATLFYLRLPIALSLLGHGLVRLPKLNTFSNWMVTSMEKSLIPASLISVFSYVLPFAEAILGAALLIGFQIRYTLIASLVLMSVLILGSSSVENWSAIEAQLIHAAYLGALLWIYEKQN